MRKVDEDKFLKSVSEESILKTWEQDTAEDHEFSKAYRDFREDLIRKAGEAQKEEGVPGTDEKIISIPSASPKRKWYRRPAGVAAAVAAALILSNGVYAISEFFRVKSQDYNGENGDYTYEIEAEDGVMVQPMRLVVNYLPEGYSYSSESYAESDAVKKYEKADGSGGLTIVLDNYSSSYTFPYVSSVENTEINGAKTDILMRNGDIEYNHIVMMFYEDSGQIVTIYGHKDISLEELKKVAENIALEPTGEEPYQAFTENNEPVQAERVLIEDSPMVEIGETMTYKYLTDADITLKVTDMEIRDDISGLSEEYFIDYDQVTSMLDENGKFGTWEWTEPVWSNNEVAEESVAEDQLGLAYITMEVSNLSEAPAEDTFVYTKMVYQNPETGEEQINYWSEPVYYDGSDYIEDGDNSHLFFSDLEVGETRTVHMGVILLKDYQEEAYLNFFDWCDDIHYVKLVP